MSATDDPGSTTSSDVAEPAAPAAGDASQPAPRLEVVPEDPNQEARDRVSAALRNHPVLRQQYPDADLWLVNLDLLDKDAGESSPFLATIHDTVSGRVVTATGRLDDTDGTVIVPTARQRRPTDEERTWAESALREHDEFRPVLEAEGAQTYPPVPPLANVQQAHGAVDRVITVGIRSEAAEARHRVVAVRTGDGEIVTEPMGAPPPSTEECGVPFGVESAPGSGDERVRVRVAQGDEVLWDLVIVRPSASSGTNGSGIELRDVRYKRHLALHHAHVPIVTVDYDEPGTGPTARTWLDEEASFEAEGDEPVPGFRVCASVPRTILDSGTGGGAFRGVALHLDGQDLVIMSQLEAGWYRYVQEWRLLADGTIRPRLGFAAVLNPSTCRPHTHHAYWRLDFDITAAQNNSVQEHNDPPLEGSTTPWQTTRFEVRRPRDAGSNRYWRVRHVRSSHGYAVMPGADDGTADAYGAGDVWILAAHGDEIDDGQGFTIDPVLARPQLDRFLTGEPMQGQDVVLWYGVHVSNSGDAGPEAGRRVGPDLVPYNWRPPVVIEEPFGQLAPPPTE